jgi:hypothetical protein
MPDPLTTSHPFRTITRRLLEGALHEEVEKLGIRCDDEVGPRKAWLQGLDMRIAQTEDALAAAQAELDELALKEPPPDPSGQLAHRRSARRHQKQHEILRRRRNSLAESLKDDRQQWAKMIAEIEEIELSKISAARHLRAVYTHAEQIYNRALVTRHPEGEIIRLLLDTSALRLPDWAEQGSDSQ